MRETGGDLAGKTELTTESGCQGEPFPIPGGRVHTEVTVSKNPCLSERQSPPSLDASHSAAEERPMALTRV